MRWVLVLSVFMLCVGCATPKKNLTREEWLNMTTHNFKDTTTESVLKAAEKVLTLSDASDDLSFQHYPARMIAQRRWNYYAVLTAAFGSYNFDITTTQQENNVMMQLYIGSTAQAVMPTPTYTPGVQGGWGGAGATATTTPVNVGIPVENPEAYNLFYQRMESILNAKEWVTCEQVIKAKAKQDNTPSYDPAQPAGYYTSASRAYDALCFMASDKAPESDVSTASSK